MRYFLFKHKNEIWLVKNPEQVPKPRELLLQNSNIEYIRDKANSLGKGLTFRDKVSRKKIPALTTEHKAKIALALSGSNNPNWGGLKEDTKAKIRRKMRGTRRNENNPMYGRRQSWETRNLIAMKARHRRRKWCVDPSGKTHLVDPLTFILPSGWMWGRFYDPYKPEDF